MLNTKIVVTGGSGRFGFILKKNYNSRNIFFPSKNKLNILNINSIRNYIKKNQPKILIHLAGLSRPMSIHNSNIINSINLNIIGTANIVKICSEFNVKLIYFSTHYVYPGKKGNYSESDGLLPINNYAWSKLGGECSVQMYKNSLILRICMTEKPFVHKKAFANVKTNFLYQEEVARILFKILNKKGIVNIGGKKQSIYNFARKENPKIKKLFLKKNNKYNIPLNPSMNTKKIYNILTKKK
jgi:dTDP-4-dehydrorhamnose reductase